jgi:hypothetical protein
LRHISHIVKEIGGINRKVESNSTSTKNYICIDEKLVVHQFALIINHAIILHQIQLLHLILQENGALSYLVKNVFDMDKEME